MRAWIIKSGEVVPYLADEAGDRLFRAGQLVEALLRRDHDVTWWAARFDHYRKAHRDVAVNRPLRPAADGPEMIFLPSRGYRRNISPARALDHHQLGRGFARLAPTLPRPDAIVCAWPTIDLADAAVAYGRAHGVPVIVDIRDHWPDIIYERLAAKTGLSATGWLWPYERMGKRVFQGAAAVTALTEGMLGWGQDRFGRLDAARDRDAVFSQCQPDLPAPDPEGAAWRGRGVDLGAPVTRLVWAGSLADTLDLQTLLAAIEKLDSRSAAELAFVFCGAGSLAPRVQDLAARLPHVTYAGWVGRNDLSTLLHGAHIGLMCYAERFDFQLSIPNKITDFTAARLRILTNLTGEIERCLGGRDILIPYPTGDSAALAEVLTGIADAPARYRRRMPAARAVFEEMFLADRIMPAFADFVEAAAASGAR